MSEKEKDSVFFLRLISEATILQRDFFSRGENIDHFLFRIIHVASSMGCREKSRNESLEVLKSYAGDDKQKKSIIEFLIDHASR